mmetsp:Transcript_13747/g.40139  ORF Transcript_13747/g.40139 Transcript_13747/m.40139 type:complete len:323 (-) Transcript_13747:988-1956(-)
MGCGVMPRGGTGAIMAGMCRWYESGGCMCGVTLAPPPPLPCCCLWRPLGPSLARRDSLPALPPLPPRLPPCPELSLRLSGTVRSRSLVPLRRWPLSASKAARAWSSPSGDAAKLTQATSMVVRLWRWSGVRSCWVVGGVSGDMASSTVAASAAPGSCFSLCRPPCPASAASTDASSSFVWLEVAAEPGGGGAREKELSLEVEVVSSVSRDLLLPLPRSSSFRASKSSTVFPVCTSAELASSSSSSSSFPPSSFLPPSLGTMTSASSPTAAAATSGCLVLASPWLPPRDRVPCRVTGDGRSRSRAKRPKVAKHSSRSLRVKGM